MNMNFTIFNVVHKKHQLLYNRIFCGYKNIYSNIFVMFYLFYQRWFAGD